MYLLFLDYYKNGNKEYTYVNESGKDFCYLDDSSYCDAYGEIYTGENMPEYVIRNAYVSIPIYPQMTNTVNYFKENKIDFEYKFIFMLCLCK